MEFHLVERSFAEAFGEERWKDKLVLVGVSGGPDSVASLRATIRIAASRDGVVAGHFNHHWRGDASIADAEFVRQLCSKLGVRLIEGSAERRLVAEKRTEERARRDRYRFLTEAAYEVGAGYVITGHTEDDRIETMLHNLLRGSGLAGLATPRAFRVLADDLVLARPLLNIFRSEILDYLNSLEQDYRTDMSNLDSRYTRNFIRHKLLPLARDHFSGGVDKQLLSMAELAEETMLALESLGRLWLEQMDESATEIPPEVAGQLAMGKFWIAPSDGFRKQPWPVVREGLRQLWVLRGWPLKSMSRLHWDRVRDIVLLSELSRISGNGQTLQILHTLPGGLQVIANEYWRGFGILPKDL